MLEIYYTYLISLLDPKERMSIPGIKCGLYIKYVIKYVKFSLYNSQGARLLYNPVSVKFDISSSNDETSFIFSFYK